MLGLKKKLKISQCELQQGGQITVKDKSFELMLNPGKFTHKYSICYNEDFSPGEQGTTMKFNATQPETVNFNFVLDSTGVVKFPLPGSAVKDQVKKLNGVVYDYDGNDHQPQFVRILWGSLIFFGRLTSMSIDYTLFKHNGTPLRAKVDVAFAGFFSAEEKSLKANKSSPDLTHIVEVQAGDTLPLLCQRIYKNGGYYMEVAKVNHLINFRDLKPGARLQFPHLA